MPLSINSILSGNTPIKSYLDDGLNLGVEPVHEHDQYMTSGPVPANSTFWWRIIDNFEPVNTIVLFPIGTNPSGTLTVSVTNPSKSTTLWSLSTNMNNGNIIGNSFILTYPAISFEKDYYGKIVCSVAADGMITTGKRMGTIRKYLPE